MIKKIYLILSIACIIYLGLLQYLTFQTIHSGLDKSELIESFYSYQSIITLSNFITFFVLLAIACLIYYKTKSYVFYICSVLVFLIFTIANIVFIAKPFFEIKNPMGPASSEFNMHIIIASFYCIGSIAISVITFITVRNIKFRKN